MSCELKAGGRTPHASFSSWGHFPLTFPTTPALAPATICGHDLQTPPSPVPRFSSDLGPPSMPSSRGSLKLPIWLFHPSLQEPAPSWASVRAWSPVAPHRPHAQPCTPQLSGVSEPPHSFSPLHPTPLLGAPVHLAKPSLASSQTQEPPPLCSLRLQEVSAGLTPNDSLSSALIETPGRSGWCWEVREHDWER